MSEKRTKFNVEYPIAKTINAAIAWMESGGEVWQECSEDFPNCMGFDDVECLMENFPHEDYEYGDDIQDYMLHLCPADRDEEYAEPFVVGEQVWASEQFFLDNNTYMHKGDSHKVVEVSADGTTIKLDVSWDDVDWPVDKFIRCVLPVITEKIYVCHNVCTASFGAESSGVYKDLDFLKLECRDESGSDILWSDECEDLEESLQKLGIAALYSSSNWDIEAIDKKTGNLLFGVTEDFLRIQYS